METRSTCCTRITSSPASDEVQSVAKKIGDTLEESRLDGRDINKTNDGLRGFSPMGAITNLLKLIPMLVLLPIILVSWRILTALGRALGDNTDEGLTTEPLPVPHRYVRQCSFGQS